MTTTHQAAHVAVLEALDRMRDCIAAHCMDIAQDERWHGILAQYADARATIAAMKQQGWQPIETAPKDGSYVLLYDDRYLHSDTSYLIAQWDGDYWWGHRTKSGKCFIWREATHWQPLPAAPTEASR